MPKLLQVFGVAALGLVQVACDQSEPVTLRLKWKAGETTRLRVVTESDTTFSGKFEMTNRRRTEFVGTQTVKSVADDGRAVVEMVLESVRHESKDGDGKTKTYDSTLGGTPDGSDIAFAAMIGVTTAVDIDADGRISDIRGIEVYFDRMRQLAAGDAVLEMIVDKMPKSLEDKMLPLAKGTRDFAPFPTNGVRVGQSWKGGAEAASSGSNPFATSTHTLKSVTIQNGEQIAEIISVGTFTPQAQSNAAPKSVKLGTVQIKGSCLFSITRGRMVSCTLKSTSTSSVEPTSAPSESQKTEITIEDKTTMEVIPAR